MQVNARELREKLSDYLHLVSSGQEIEVTKHDQVIARLVPPSKTKLDIESLKNFHLSLGITKPLPNAVLLERKDAES